MHDTIDEDFTPVNVEGSTSAKTRFSPVTVDEINELKKKEYLKRQKKRLDGLCDYSRNGTMIGKYVWMMEF